MSDKKDHEIKVVNVRLVKEPSLYSSDPIRSPEDVLKVIAGELATYDREVFLILNLKTNGQVINMSVCSIGTLNASLVSPREVFKSAILSNAGAFICLHLCKTLHKWTYVQSTIMKSQLPKCRYSYALVGADFT